MKLKLLFTFLTFSFISFSQVGIGTTTPDPATLLHVDDGTGKKGILIPRVSIANLNNIAPLTTTPQKGTLVFNSSGANPEGFYYWEAANG